MQVAVISSHTFSNYSFLSSQLSSFPISSIVSGGAAGADSLASITSLLTRLWPLR
jgi:hypothetical protein